MHNADYMKLKKSNIPDKRFNAAQLKRGIKVEMEHTDNKETAKAIAKAHLAEAPNYYIELAKMEKRLKSPKKTRGSK